MGQLKFKRSHLSIPSTNDPSSLLSLSFPKSSKLILSLSTCQVCLVFCSPRKKPQPKLPSMASTMVASKLIVASKLASVLRHELQLQCLAVASLPTYYFTQSSLVASLASWPHLSSHAKAAWQQAHKLTSSQAHKLAEKAAAAALPWLHLRLRRQPVRAQLRGGGCWLESQLRQTRGEMSSLMETQGCKLRITIIVRGDKNKTGLFWSLSERGGRGVSPNPIFS